MRVDVDFSGNDLNCFKQFTLMLKTMKVIRNHLKDISWQKLLQTII